METEQQQNKLYIWFITAFHSKKKCCLYDVSFTTTANLKTTLSNEKLKNWKFSFLYAFSYDNILKMFCKLKKTVENFHVK